MTSLCNPLATIQKVLGPVSRAGIFKKSLGARKGTEEEEGYRTGPPGYIGWRNSFLGIDSGAPYTFKNTGSELGKFPSRAAPRADAGRLS